MKLMMNDYRWHYKDIMKLSLPVIASQIGQITVGLADNIMIGQYGSLELAASSFATKTGCRA